MTRDGLRIIAAYALLALVNLATHYRDRLRERLHLLLA